MATKSQPHLPIPADRDHHETTCLGCGRLIVQSYSRSGWRHRPRRHQFRGGERGHG